MPPKVNLTYPLPTHSFYTNRGAHKGLALLWHRYRTITVYYSAHYDDTFR